MELLLNYLQAVAKTWGKNMSDSSCSNCEKQDCEFRDVSYECYRNGVELLQKTLLKKDVTVLKNIAEKYTKLYEEHGLDEFNTLKFAAELLLDMYNNGKK